MFRMVLGLVLVVISAVAVAGPVPSNRVVNVLIVKEYSIPNDRIKAAVKLTNDAFKRSGVVGKLRIAKIKSYSWLLTPSIYNVPHWQVLNLAAHNPGIQKFRNKFLADIVIVARDGRTDGAGYGYAYILGNHGSQVNSDLAFAVIDMSADAPLNEFPHEIGHIFGNQHERESTADAGRYTYSHGFVGVNADGLTYKDIMAVSNTDISEMVYSSLKVNCALSSTGVYSVCGADYANASRTIHRMMPVVARFR